MTRRFLRDAGPMGLQWRVGFGRLSAIGVLLAISCGAPPSPPVPGNIAPSDPGPSPRQCHSADRKAPAVLAEAVVDRQIAPTMLELINGATRCIDVFEFEFVQTGSVNFIRSALVAAANRGVSVRVLLDDEVDANIAAVRHLRSHGIDARRDQDPVRTHLKLVAVDGEELLIGSTNFSGASFDFNHETNALIRDPAAVDLLYAYLDALWLGRDYRSIKGDFNDDSPVVPWTDGGYEALARPALAAATERVDLILYAINLDPRFDDGPVARLADAVMAAHDRGAVVRVLLERSPWANGINMLNEQAAATFRARGIEVRFDDLETVTHAKLLLADGVAFVGTNNWSYSGLVTSHEAGVKMTPAPVVDALSAYFDARWAEGD